MKTNKLFISIVILFITLLFSSYSANRTTPANVEGDTLNPSKNYTPNPYDYMGKIYVALLDSAVKGKITLAQVPEVIEKAMLSRKEYKEIKPDMNDSIWSQLKRAYSEASALTANLPKDSANKIIYAKLTQYVKNWAPYIQRMHELASAEFLDTLSLKLVYSQMDKKILNDPKLSEFEKAFLLTESTIGKYTYRYIKFDKDGKYRWQNIAKAPLIEP
jgi:hypothetical protein